MGKPGRWLKSVLLGKKTSKSSGSTEKKRNGKEVVVVSKIEESDVVSDLPSSGNAAVFTNGMVETQNIEHVDVSDNEMQLREVEPTDSQDASHVPDDSLNESEKIEQEIAATIVQAAFRGYLARRAFLALKGIIRLQALIRGHMVRRQAVSTLCCVMGIVRLQALARGRNIRHSEIGVEVHKKCRLNHHHLENKLTEDSTHTYLGIKKLTENAFAQKLLASSPNMMPLNLGNDSSNSIWLENWSVSCFWKPVSQPKKASVNKPKKSFQKAPTSNLDNLDKPPKRSFRKVSTNQSLEPPHLAMENPQVDLEKVKRGLRKVHNPIVENSIQPQPAVENPNPGLEESVNAIDETVVEQPEELLQTCTMVNQIEEDAKEERTPKQNEDSASKENQKSGKKDSSTVEYSSPGIPSYMQATKSAKAKLKLQSSSSPIQLSTEKATRRYSLPSSGNNAKVITSGSPKTTRILNSGGKTEKKKTENKKTTSVEWKR